MSKEQSYTLKPIHVEIYNEIKRYKDENVYSPTIKEVAENIDKSSRHVGRKIDELVDMEYLKKEPKNKRRNIKIIDDLG